MHIISTQSSSVTANAHSSVINLAQKVERAEGQPHDAAHSINSAKKALTSVSISPQAHSLLAAEQSKIQSTADVDVSANPSPENPIETTKPVIKDNEKLDNYVHYKKAQMKYQIYADMANISSGNSDSIKPATAYYLSNNEDARAFTVNSMAQNHQVAMLNTYAETTKSAQSNSINTKT
ncbi:MULTISPECIES: hypothetical protein [Pseudomonadati]|uniref:Uncharacterized protein n=1 Tax=Shewanella aestuarii TaxID=1028752 RepID=A0ABT0L3A1_9GAMM|nr:hypothetical protein [Shewanella aestuarii]MCL1118196.1 hypothetical protein [Shewanella aestuarii]GGN81363.1 hypothetical protein GCM10009193_27470 [Shewanella aestuarii]